MMIKMMVTMMTMMVMIMMVLTMMVIKMMVMTMTMMMFQVRDTLRLRISPGRESLLYQEIIEVMMTPNLMTVEVLVGMTKRTFPDGR